MRVEFNRIISKIERQGFKYIGSGSGRIVYDLENGYIIKVAKNNRGIAQNIVENKISLECSTNILVKVEYFSDNYIYLIMKKAEPIKEYSEILQYFNIKNMRELKKVKDIQVIKDRYNLIWQDLLRGSSWGIIEGHPVIVDYGFTRKVAIMYYI